MNYSTRIANAISAFFKTNDWHFDFDPDKGIFHYTVHTHCRLQSIRSHVDVHDDFFMVYAYCPIKVDPHDHEAMNAMSEFVCRANYGMVTGNFELDWRDGEIRYKVYVKYPDDSALSDELIAYNIFCPCKQIESYSDGLIDVMFGGGVSPKDAVDKCEKMQLLRLLNELGPDDSSDGSTPSADDSDVDGTVNFDLFDEGEGGES